MSNRLYNFVHALNAEQRARFANMAGTSVANIRHYTTGRRVPSSETAIAMERAATRLRNGDASLPPLSRRDLSPACRGCEYAKWCTQKLA